VVEAIRRARARPGEARQEICDRPSRPRGVAFGLFDTSRRCGSSTGLISGEKKEFTDLFPLSLFFLEIYFFG